MIRLAFALLVVAGCLHTDTTECADGRTCPAGTLCDKANKGCAVAEQFAACLNIDPGMPCTWPDGTGECVNGVCLGQFCGDGRRSGNEPCDWSDPAADTTMCTGIELGYYQGGDTMCAPNCTWDVSPCAERCGDHVINGSEICEMDIAPVESCLDYAFDRGTLGCGACAPNFDDCGLIGWRRRVLPAKPSRVIAVGANVMAAIDTMGSPNLAARFVGGGWVGFGSYAVTGDSPTAVAIAATSADDIWVGGPTNNATSEVGYVARFDGTAWTRVRTFPAVVTALWAAGTHVFAMAGADLYIFDGTAWTSQTLATSSIGFSISGDSIDDVWIGGTKLWHGGAGQTFTDVTPVVGTVSGVYAFGPDQVVAAVHETSANRLAVYVRENSAWRAVVYGTGATRGEVYARSGSDVYLLAADLTPKPLVAHHDGSSWVTISEPTMSPTAFAGSPDAIVAVERTIDTAYHYGGAAWLPRISTTGSQPSIRQLTGLRPDALYATGTDTVRTLYLYDGATWGQISAEGAIGILSSTIMYAADINPLGNNSQLHYPNGIGGWNTLNLAGGTTDRFAEWIGVNGMNDVFLKQLVGGVPRYHHWAGGIMGGAAQLATLETSSLPDGEVLNVIDCKPGAGCYAGGTSLWHTPGDKDLWAKDTSIDIGPINAIWVEDATFTLVAGSQGRIAHGNGSTFTISQLPTNAPVLLLAVATATDAFALTRSVADEDQLYHWDGTLWSRVRLPVPAFGAKINQLWSAGRITYLGHGEDALVANRWLYALVRTEPW
jgi:hypothetical protein